MTLSKNTPDYKWMQASTGIAWWYFLPSFWMLKEGNSRKGVHLTRLCLFSVQVTKFSVCILCSAERHVVIHSTVLWYTPLLPIFVIPPLKPKTFITHTLISLVRSQRSRSLSQFFLSYFRKAYSNIYVKKMHRSSAPNVAAFKASLRRHLYLKHHKLFDCIDTEINQKVWPWTWWTACFSSCRAPEVRGKFTVLAREITLLKETSTSRWWWGAGSINRRVSEIWEVKACVNLSYYGISVTL